jgi:hypothetical protein
MWRQGLKIAEITGIKAADHVRRPGLDPLIVPLKVDKINCNP